MPDLIELLGKWWKQILTLVVVSVLIAGIISFLKPVKYLATATSVPASSFASDRSKVFNENIQALYSSLGTADDLDMILGTAQLDTVYLSVAEKFPLTAHYKTKEQGEAARIKNAFMLRKNTRVSKSGYGELKVKVWDTDPDLAAELANAVMDKLQSMHQDLQAEGNRTTASGLIAAKEKIIAEMDSIKYFLSTASFLPGDDAPYNARLNNLATRLNGYEKLIAEYEVLVSSKQPVLIPVEKARPASWPDKPRRVRLLVGIAFLSFLFSILAVLILERRKLKT